MGELVGVVVSMAVASGARGAEAVVVLTDGEVAPGDVDIVRDFAASARASVASDGPFPASASPVTR